MDLMKSDREIKIFKLFASGKKKNFSFPYIGEPSYFCAALIELTRVYCNFMSCNKVEVGKGTMVRTILAFFFNKLCFDVMLISRRNVQQKSSLVDRI